MLIFDERERNIKARIKVMGVGGGGSNAVSHMVRENLDGAFTIASNTDIQALEKAKADKKLQLGAKLTRGLGAGGDPDIGKRAMEESREEVRRILEDTDMVFFTAGMGGGTGTGGLPVAAQIASDMDILSVAVVTRPFRFEGPVRSKNAENGLRELRGKVDSLLLIPNDRLLEIVEPQTSIMDAFRMADRVLFKAVKGIIDIIMKPGLINVDFADVRTIMGESGEAIMGTGIGRGPTRAEEATKRAISSPLLDGASIRGAKGILVNIVGDESITLKEIERAISLVVEEASKGEGTSNIIFGTVIDPSMGDSLQITVVATGITRKKRETKWLKEEEETSFEDIRIPAYKRKAKESSPLSRWKTAIEEEGKLF